MGGQVGFGSTPRFRVEDLPGRGDGHHLAPQPRIDLGAEVGESNRLPLLVMAEDLSPLLDLEGVRDVEEVSDGEVVYPSAREEEVASDPVPVVVRPLEEPLGGWVGRSEYSSWM